MDLLDRLDMMNRIKKISIKIRDSIDQFFDDLDDNETDIEKALSDMKNRIPEAIDLVATAIAEEKRLKYEYRELLKINQMSDRNISQDEVEPRSAWENECLNKINVLDRQIKEQERVVAELKSDLFDFYQAYKNALKRARALSIRQNLVDTQVEFYRRLLEFGVTEHEIPFQKAENELKKTEAKVKMLKQKNVILNKKTKENGDDFNIDKALDELKRDILGSGQND
ncbi:hypothetical protein JT359_04270 [Candidatus Poribacteria bacterium]|nr:hypothetical protein [Candidatus Poribacteria bacterium]